MRHSPAMGIARSVPGRRCAIKGENFRNELFHFEQTLLG
jgi:hypothetical protein